MTIPLDEVFEEVKEEPVIETVHEEMPVYEPEKVEIKESPKEEPLKPIKEKIKVIGQTRGTYILGENERGFYIIDQHAKTKRINYEYFLNKFSHPDLSIQPMIVPLTFEYPESECLVIDEHKGLLKKLESILNHLADIHTLCVVYLYG